MKTLISFVLVVISLQLFAQTNPITAINITLPANPDANTANWGTGVSLLTITASAKSVGGRIDPSVEESRILVIIKKGGSKICGTYTSSNAPAANINSMTKVWSGDNAVSLLGQDCTLPPGDYELSVQFFGYSLAKQAPISEEKTKPFTIRGNDQQAYQAPQLIVPATGTAFKEDDIRKPITFRWTPVTPRPATPVTYRLSVWQLMTGQTDAQAIKANQPIFTKDIDNLTQAVVSNVINGPCKPPYMCSYVWTVQVLSRDGKGYGANNGISEIHSFRLAISSNTDEKQVVRSNVSGNAGDLINALPAARLPLNGATIKQNERLKFAWEGVSSRYKLKIVEVTGNQSAAEAFRTNKPFFEKDTLNELSVSYIPSALKFIAGKKYAWAVQALSREGKPIGGKDGTSNINEFVVITSNDGVGITDKIPAQNKTVPAKDRQADSFVPLNNGCPRRNVTWTNIARELNKVSHCAVPVNGYLSYTQIETSNFTVLQGYNQTQVITVAMQNALVAQATQWALNNRPVGCNNSLKSIIGITYLTDVIVGSGAHDNVVGITVQYGCCSGTVNNQHQ